MNLDPLSTGSLSDILRRARAAVPAMVATPVAAILDVLHRCGQAWQPGSPLWQQALDMTAGEISFSRPMIDMSLAVIPQLLNKSAMLARLTADIGDPERLDRFVTSPSFGGRVRAWPLGVLFHVSAGNVFLGAIDSLLMGFLSKNVSVVKLSSRNTSFPELFAASLRAVDPERILADKFHLVHFPGGERSLEDLVKSEVDGIIAWGGDEMISSYKRAVPPGVRFFEYGPKISFQVVLTEALDAVGYAAAGTRIARDIAVWDQAACASPQNLFCERGVDIPRLMDAIGAGFSAVGLPRGKLSDDEYVEILKEKARAQYSRLVEGGASVDGPDYFLHYDPTPGLRTSALNRTLIVKSFDSTADLVDQVRPFARHLQSCGYLATPASRDALLSALGTVGVMRFTQVGQVMQAPIGAPHDGRMGLTELVRLVPDERDMSLAGLVQAAVAEVPFYRERARGRSVQDLNDLDLIVGKDLAAGSAAAMQAYVRADVVGGHVFSSGGTSGAPKFSFYGDDEFAATAGLLATGFAAQGVQAGDVVANLFVAGNMWSSFLAVDHALARIGARTLPIGGAADHAMVLDYLERFPPQAVLGLPTQLLELGRSTQASGRALHIPTVLYAGEHLSLMARSFLRGVWGTERFGSAGYASVDAGPIGYQCLHCTGGIHHLFAEHVHLEMIEGEAVVTSLVRRAMPVLRLRTGDLVRPIAAVCPCGSAQPRFELLGRADSQFNIWGCRLFLEDVERSLADLGLDGALYQLVLRQDDQATESLELRVEHGSGEVHGQPVLTAFYDLAKDLRATHPFAWFVKHATVVGLPAGGIARVARTGKIRLLIDER